VAVGTGVLVGVDVGVAEGGTGVLVGVRVFVDVGVPVGDGGVFVGVGVTVGVLVSVTVAVGVSVRVGVLLGVGVNVGAVKSLKLKTLLLPWPLRFTVMHNGYPGVSVWLPPGSGVTFSGTD
jgi:hypothetical protein